MSSGGPTEKDLKDAEAKKQADAAKEAAAKGPTVSTGPKGPTITTPTKAGGPSISASTGTSPIQLRSGETEESAQSQPEGDKTLGTDKKKEENKDDKFKKLSWYNLFNQFTLPIVKAVGNAVGGVKDGFFGVSKAFTGIPSLLGGDTTRFKEGMRDTLKSLGKAYGGQPLEARADAWFSSKFGAPQSPQGTENKKEGKYSAEELRELERRVQAKEKFSDNELGNIMQRAKDTLGDNQRTPSPGKGGVTPQADTASRASDAAARAEQAAQAARREAEERAKNLDIKSGADTPDARKPPRPGDH